MNVVSVGRIVHYVSHGTPNQEYKSECRAAIITALDKNPESSPEPGQVFVSLCVLNPTGSFFNTFVLQDEEDHIGGTWHWPERIDET